MKQNERNNSWDAVWSDAAKGIGGLLIVLAIFGLMFFGFKALLIIGAVIVFFLLLRG
jgi:hypothetical protein